MARKSILATVAVVIAAVGALLVFMYARGADARASADVVEQQVLVSTAQVDAGEKVDDAIAAGKFEITAVPASAVLPGALMETEPISDQVATSTIYPGEQLVAQKFGSAGSSTALSIGKGEMAVSLQVTASDRVGDFLGPGASAAVYFTDGDAENPLTRLLLEKVTVVAIGQTTASSTTPDDTGAAAPAPADTVIVTLSVDQADAGKVVYASKHGQVTFALLTENSVTGPDEGTTSDNLFE